MELRISIDLGLILFFATCQGSKRHPFGHWIRLGNHRDLRTHILRLLGPKTILYKGFWAILIPREIEIKLISGGPSCQVHVLSKRRAPNLCSEAVCLSSFKLGV